MSLPSDRGPLSRTVLNLLSRGQAYDVDHLRRCIARVRDPLTDGDLQLALGLCYELSYQGLPDIDDGWEWDHRQLALRAEFERTFEQALRNAVPAVRVQHAHVWDELRDLVDSDPWPSLSTYLARRASLPQFREFVQQRSIYHLREADSHTFGIPRLAGTPKAAMVEIQTDEYGGGRLHRMHSSLFAAMMRELGLDDTYGAYWDVASAETLASVNALTLFGLHRRLRGALCGHLAALEMTSTGPNRNYGNGLRRLGLSARATAFYDEHVEADAVHENIAAVNLCGALVEQDPAQRPLVTWGAGVCLALDGAAAGSMLESWGALQHVA